MNARDLVILGMYREDELDYPEDTVPLWWFIPTVNHAIDELIVPTYTLSENYPTEQNSPAGW